MQKGEMKSMTTMMTAENRADHKSMWQHFGVLRVKRQKMGLNRRPFAYTAVKEGGGLDSHPTPNHVIGKRTVNATLAMGHQADPVHC
jgi:hypothetical protein